MNIIQSAKLAATIGQKWFVRNAPDVLTGISIGMSAVAVALTIPATTKAEQLIDERQKECDILAHERGEEPKLIDNIEKVKACWACYVPTLLTLGTSITAAIFANHISATRIATLGAAYGIAEKKILEYQDAVGGLNKDNQKKVHDAIIDDYIAKNPVEGGQIERTGHGDTLFIDKETGRKFYASYYFVAEAFKRISDNLVHEMTQTINDLYSELSLDESTQGHSLGWNASDWPLNPVYDERHTETGETFYVITYPWQVLYDFRDF